jgi:hypothetical protein
MNAVTAARRQALEPSTLSEAMQFAGMLARSTMVPKDFLGKPENILVAIQWGREVGLGPMQALQGIAVINGRPSIWGDAALALVRAHPDCQDVIETVTGDGEQMVATCEVRRRGSQPVVRTFTVADAKKAGLWGKQGPWAQYPRRMLQMRARGFAIRDAFPDALRGVVTTEEAQDTPVDTFTGTTIDHSAAPIVGPDALVNQKQEYTDKKPTSAEWITRLEADLGLAQNLAAVEEIVARPDVVRMGEWLKNGALARLNSAIKAGRSRFAERVLLDDEIPALAEDDEFPGDRQTEAAA